MNAHKLLAIARKGRPHVIYALNKKHNAIGAWVPELNRFVAVAGLLLNGEWGELKHELLINGQPVFTEWET